MGDRDPAQPLLTLVDGPARVELSGATAANWVAKTAHLLTTGLGAPERVGVVLPLHWQAVTLLLGAVTAGATVVVPGSPAGLAGCDAAFTTADDAEAALDAGVEEVLAVSTAPLGGRLPDLPVLVLDAGRELPVHGDTWTGPLPRGWSIEVGGDPVRALPRLPLGPTDRVLTVLGPRTRTGLLTGVLGPLAAGSALVLCPAPPPDLAEVLAAEGVTAVVGLDVPGLPRLDADRPC